MQKSTLYGLILFVMVVAGGLFLTKSDANPGVTGNVVANGVPTGAFQEVVLGIRDYNYYPEEVTVKANEPVRLSMDKTSQGCFRDFTIRELGVRKYLMNEDDYVEFTPTKTGTYTFSCSMGMGLGKLIVE